MADEVSALRAKTRSSFRMLVRNMRAWIEASNASPDHPTYAKEVVAAERDGVVVVAATGEYAASLKAWCAKNNKHVEIDPRGGVT